MICKMSSYFNYKGNIFKIHHISKEEILKVLIYNISYWYKFAMKYQLDFDGLNYYGWKFMSGYYNEDMIFICVRYLTNGPK